MRSIVEKCPALSWTLIALLVLCFLVAAGEGLAATWIVDPFGGPGVNFTDIPPAISAAAPGDLILVHDGIYSGFTLEKGLTLMAEVGHQALVSQASCITNISANESVVVSGLDFNTTSYYFAGLAVGYTEGPVHLDNCTSNTFYSVPGFYLLDCAQVVISRCHIEKQGAGTEAAALFIYDSTAIISECELIGQDGEGGFDMTPGMDGGPGLWADESTVYLQASSSIGGEGGWYSDSTGYLLGPGDGGAAINLVNSTLHLFGRDRHLMAGGRGGFTNYGAWGEGGNAILAENSTVAYSGITLTTPGSEPEIAAIGSTVIELVPDVPVMTLGGSGLMGDSIIPTLHGEPGSLYRIFLSTGAIHYPMPDMYTDFFLNPPYLTGFHTGLIPPGGEVAINTYIPVIPAWQGVPIVFQAYVETPTGKPYLSTSAAFVLR